MRGNVGAYIAILTAGIFAFPPLPTQADPLREIEITADKPENGQQVFTVRMTPGETVQCDKLTFDCVYHQEYQSQTSDQKKKTESRDPASFTYRRKDIKLVDDLDSFVSFRVPISMQRLVDIYGESAFNTNVAVRVSKMIITAVVEDKPIWTYEVEAKGLHKPPPAPVRPSPQPPPPEKP